ncbi:MAG: sigma-54-dependent Fis family transcriptional regulator [Candidatus Parabeggiatoa sp. nov. 1]|nr:MAG: sigma-54-dependent Fis family transcriptional regulator [Gammaproteobacteria bacterium]
MQVTDAKLFSTLSGQETKRWGISGFIGKSKTFTKILDDIRRLQEVEKTNVFILGESGTGKELIARAIHFGGIRAKEPFLPVICSAIPADLAESHFFCHVKGAFTGAVCDRKGYFEQADGGTLFLDEIGDMPTLLQAKLLRTLEDGTLMPVGGNREKKVNVRVLAATNADLPAKIATNEFREALYYRLGSYTIHAPPLRERKENIPLLVKHLLSMLAAEMCRPEPTLTPEALATLENYDFPGNIRELKNRIEHALISCDGAPIQPAHFDLIEPAQVIESNEKSASVEPTLSEQALLIGGEEKILAYVREQGSINNTQCRQLLNLDYHKSSYLLKKLAREGKLVREGERRGAYYRLP